MLKHAITLAAVAGLVFALAPAATVLAAPIPVTNGSFEDPWLDPGGWPTSGANATGWDYVEDCGGDSFGLDGRDNYAGPTDGYQSVLVDNRLAWCTAPEDDYMRQTIGTGADFTATPLLEMSIDARYQGSAVEPDGVDYVEFYFEVNGAQAGTGFKSFFDDTRLIPNADELGVTIGTRDTYPDPDYMETFTATLNATGLGAGDEIKFVIHNHRENETDHSSRVLIDNVRGVATPEPATLALLGLGAVGTLLARRRRK